MKRSGKTKQDESLCKPAERLQPQTMDNLIEIRRRPLGELMWITNFRVMLRPPRPSTCKMKILRTKLGDNEVKQPHFKCSNVFVIIRWDVDRRTFGELTKPLFERNLRENCENFDRRTFPRESFSFFRNDENYSRIFFSYLPTWSTIGNNRNFMSFSWVFRSRRSLLSARLHDLSSSFYVYVIIGLESY